MYDVSLSSMWAVGRFEDAAAFVAAARRLGCARVEANHELSPRMLEGLVDLSREHPDLVSSVHDPCPAVMGLREMSRWDCLLSSVDPESRERAVQITRQTIATARTLGAHAVVLHVGRVQGIVRLDRQLRKRYGTDQWAAPETDELRQALARRRAQLCEPFLEAVVHSLAELVPDARAAGVRLGLENRYYYPEIPSWDDLARLLEPLPTDVVGYWHDVGHAQAMEALGFTRHEEWLQAYGDRCIGVHLHDCRGMDDHRPPGQGDVDWAMVHRTLPDTALRVLEVSKTHSPADLVAGVRHLADRGFYGSA